MLDNRILGAASPNSTSRWLLMAEHYPLPSTFVPRLSTHWAWAARSFFPIAPSPFSFIMQPGVIRRPQEKGIAMKQLLSVIACAALLFGCATEQEPPIDPTAAGNMGASGSGSVSLPPYSASVTNPPPPISIPIPDSSKP